MADEPGATPDDAQEQTATATAGDGAADVNAQTDGHASDEPQGFADFARADLTRQLNELENGRAGAEEGADGNKTDGPPAQPAPGAPGPDGKPSPGGDHADGQPDVFANLRSAAEQIGDPQLVEQVNAHLAEYENYEREVSTYVQDVQQYAGRVQQQEQEVNQRLQYLERIAGDPRFQQALQQVTGQAGTAGGAGNAAPAGRGPDGGASDGKAPTAPEFENDTERFLYQQLQDTQRKLDQFERDNQQRTAAEQKAQLAQYREQASATLQKLAEDLPKKFPGVQMNEDLHKQASYLIEGQAARGERINIEAAYEAAAKLQTYEAQQHAGAKRATETARAAARSSNHPADARTTTITQVDSLGDALELTKEQFRAAGKKIPAGV